MAASEGVRGWALQATCLWGIPVYLKLFCKLLGRLKAKHFSYGKVLCVVRISVPPSSAVFLGSFHFLLLPVFFPLGPGPLPLAHVALFSE